MRDEAKTKEQLIAELVHLRALNEKLEAAAVQRTRAEQGRLELAERIGHARKLESLARLAGGVAHHLNNALQVIVGNTEMALQHLVPGMPLHECVKEIEKAAFRASDLGTQMLACSGNGHLHVERMDLSHVVNATSQIVGATICDDVILKHKLADGLPVVAADGGQLRRLLSNLVANASEAIGDEGGIITITTGLMKCERDCLAELYLAENLPDGSYVYIEVSDTGCGMDSTTQTKVFDPFFSTKFIDRGLGMAVVLGIVRGHKGAIKIHSKPGQGTTVRVLFPVHKARA